MVVKKRLGRGLDALLSTTARAEAADSRDTGQYRELAVELLKRGRYQPRQDIRQESLEDLAGSIRAQGVVQPIVVRAIAGGYELIAGERRWRACQLAGLQEVPALVRELDDRAAAAVALIENVQREDLNPLEEAMALQRLGQEFELTHQQIAEAVGRSRASVSNLVRLLDLADEVKDMLQCGEIEMGHARALLALDGLKQVNAAREVSRKRLTVRQAEALVRRLQAPPPSTSAAPAKNNGSADIRALEQELAERLGAVVNIKHGHDGKGSLTISYGSLDQLEGVLSHLRDKAAAGH